MDPGFNRTPKSPSESVSSAYVHFKKRIAREYMNPEEGRELPTGSQLISQYLSEQSQGQAQTESHTQPESQPSVQIESALTPPESSQSSPALPNERAEEHENIALELSRLNIQQIFCCSPSDAGSHDSGYADVEPLDLSYSSNIHVPSPLVPIRKHNRVTARESNFGRCKFICEDCGKNYKSASQYRAHVRRHESKQTGRYSCSVCNKNFVQRSSLKTHERIHTGEKPYQCNLCEERFGDFSTFTKHRRTHTGEKPYVCPICKRSFSQSGNMHRHLKVVHKNELCNYYSMDESMEE